MTTETMWVPDITRIDGPRYLAVAAAIAKAIDSGELAPGAQLPPQRDLADRLGVTVGTVSRAYALVKKRRLVSGEVGRGTFVEGVRRPAAAEAANADKTPRAVDFACFRSPVEGLSDLLAKALMQVGERSALLPLHKYPPGAGFMSHRTAGAAWIRRSGLNVGPENVLVCGGAQQAIAVAMLTFVGPGDILLTERVTYSGTRSLATLHGIRLQGVAMDDDGMLPDALEEACRATGARVVYLQSRLHNPTGITMPAERQRQIVAVARRLDLILVEDDAVASASTALPEPLAALAPERTCYITSVSKSISPLLRLGYIAVPPHLFERLAATYHTMALSESPVVAEVMALMMSNGWADDIARRYLEEMEQRHALARSLLPGVPMRSNPAAFFLWLTLPAHWSVDEFVPAAEREGLVLASAVNFTVDRDRPVHAVRVSLNPSTSQEVLRRGLTTLAGLLAARPYPKTPVI
ncbi:PLP-dependent aminotransferase family protein [Azospirillum sp. RWY-5-1]|uniref:PLP-dependent aminotransferase family protein n=1 Tax=Azospirillum oleiclasticum TaxID=2735135 RepID=A0ABX2TKZ4_9PROT|nr:PLP-dependent aminotransferase family protein [Azospirillum oleiclasticum]NYZ16539.1 PLP-dependent aminotransferase family protein [Azospirillum oleiclasticum]NYZ23991.1 PLP-dependent aminotransferase family protein [Azospirillum oleiclasticum]